MQLSYFQYSKHLISNITSGIRQFFFKYSRMLENSHCFYCNNAVQIESIYPNFLMYSSYFLCIELNSFFKCSTLDDSYIVITLLLILYRCYEDRFQAN